MQKNKYILKRKILLITFTLMLIFSLATITFSWYRNYVEVTGPEITTGHINVNMHTYYVNNNVINEEQTKTINENTHGNVVLNSGIQSFIPDGKTHMYYFFENPGNNNSIDLEVLLSMNIEGLYTDYEVSKIGGVNITLDNETADFKDWVTQRYPTNPIFSEARFESYIKDANVNHTGGDTKNFLELEQAMITGSVNKNDILCIRVTVSLNEAFTVSHLNKQYPLRMSLCVAQEGGLPGLEKVTTFYASTLSSLNAALNLYKPNDKIIITDDIDYVGDLIINRPVEIYVQDGVLNVYGNFMFTYSYPGKFMVNTAQTGQICVYRINNAGGDFEIDVPKASIELIGRNNSINGNADIYVQRNMVVSASEDTGLIMTSSRICETVGEGIFLDTLKDIELGNHTRIEVGSRTNVGNIHSEGSIIRVRNNGTINEINLELLQQDITYVTSPNIFIDNYSNISVIKLPEWGSKFIMTETEDPSTGEPVQDYTGNTRIVSNMGASFVSITCSGDFKYDGSKDPERDDVEYETMSQFVEVVNGDKTDVIVHYTLTEIEDMENDNTLQGIMQYYINKNVIAPFNEIKKLKIITYSGSFLRYTNNNDDFSKDDYELIRDMMTSITHLDLSEASSVNYSVPTNAFLNRTSLNSVDMSETDSVWNDYIFQGTSVIEIRIPSSVISVTGSALTNIKYIHSDYNVIDNVAKWNSSKNAYVFAPDKTTFDAYLAKGTSVHRTFLEAARYTGKLGDYFFRVNEINQTFEVATIIASSYDLNSLATSDYMFNFDTMVLNGVQYKLTAIDAYAFNTKTFTNGNDEVHLVFGDQITSIEKYAFSGIKNVKTITFLGPTRIGECGFNGISTLITVQGENVPYVGTKSFASCGTLYHFYMPSVIESGDYFLNGIKSLKLAEFGMIGNSISGVFGSATCDTIVIHTDNAMEPAAYNSVVKLDVTYNMIIVNEAYSELWATQYKVNNFGSQVVPIDGSAKNIIRVSNGVYPEYLYYKNQDNTLTLLRCMTTNLSVNKGVYTVPTVSKVDESLVYENNNVNAYPLSSISRLAYYNIAFTNVETLTFLNETRKIDEFAFYGNRIFGILELNNIEEVGNKAFANNKMVKINAPELNTAGDAAFGSCANVYMAMAPKLRNTGGTVFSGNTNLHFLLLGPCDENMKGTTNNANLKLIVVDGTEATATVKPTVTSSAYPTLIVGTASATATDTFVESLDDIYYSDFYEVTVTANGIDYEFEVPQYVYYVKDDKLILAFRTAIVNEDDYFVPSEIYLTGKTIEFLGKTVLEFTSTKPVNYSETNDRYIATRIENYAFKYTKFNSNCQVVLGDNFLEIGQYTFNNNTFASIDVSNVILLDGWAFQGCKMTKFVGDKVETIASNDTFGNTVIKSLSFPNLVTFTGNWTFRNAAVEELRFGDRLTSLGHHCIHTTNSLKLIYIPSTVFNNTSKQFIYTNMPVDTMKNLKFYVDNSMLSFFQKYVKSGNGLSSYYVESNIIPFQNAYREESTGLDYLWTDMDGNKAKIDQVLGLNSTSGVTVLTLPDSFILKIDENEVQYNVTQLDSIFFDNLKGANYITKLVLPDNLEVLEGDNSSLYGTAIAEITIAETNSKYETIDGVLYTKGLKALLLYPIAKQDVSYNVPSSVETIYQYAFIGNIYLKSITISNKVTIMDGVFNGCTSLNEVIFNSTNASVLIGKNIFYSTGSNLVLYVPTGTLNDYISNIIFDLDIIDLLQERSNG